MTVGTDIRITVNDAEGAEISRRSFPGPRVRVGRVQAITEGSNDIVLPDDAVSREHAHFFVQGAVVTLVDLGSLNGTMVNGQMVHEQRVLQPGDSIGIGPYLLRCDATRRAPGPPPDPAAPATADLAPADPDIPDFDFLLDPPAPPDEPPDSDLADLEYASDPTPEAPPTRPPVDSPARGTILRDDLASTYRALAHQHGAPAWGRPPLLQASDWARVLASVRAVIDEPLWPERLADELCGTGPLAALLDDPEVTTITVPGAGPIQVRRGEARELASARFSCPEALLACYERWTGAVLADTGTSALQLSEDLSVVTVSQALAPAGPVLHIMRSSAPRGLAELGLPPAVMTLLGAALDRRARFIVHGDAATDLGLVAAALATRRPSEQLAVRIARSTSWPADPAMVALAGEQPDSLPCARRLHPDWLIVEELAAGDILELRAAMAGPLGMIATLRARSAEAALQRLVTALATATGGEAPTCRAELSHDLNLFIGVRHVGGRPRIHSIRELRPGDRGELVELFLLKPDHAALEPTGVEPQFMRERSP